METQEPTERNQDTASDMENVAGLPPSKRLQINEQVKGMLEEVSDPKIAAAIENAKQLLEDRAYQLGQLPEDTPTSPPDFEAE